jgi:hypothetical protein
MDYRPDVKAMLLTLCLCCASTSWGQNDQPASPDVSKTGMSKERLELIRSKLPALFTEGVEPASTFEDVIRNDDQRLGNFHRECPDLTERFLVVVDFVNLLRPQDENDVLVQEGGSLFLDPREEAHVFSNILLFLDQCAKFCTNDVRLWELARDFAENRTGSDSRFSLPAASRALQFMGMCRVPQAAPYLEKASTEAFWMAGAMNASKKARKLLPGDVGSLRYAAIRGIGNLPHETAIPVLERISKEITKSDFTYNTTWRILDEMWRRKNGDLPLDEYGTRYEYPLGGEVKRPTSYPAWIYGAGGEKIEWPFGSGLMP